MSIFGGSRIPERTFCCCCHFTNNIKIICSYNFSIDCISTVGLFYCFNKFRFLPINSSSISNIFIFTITILNNIIIRIRRLGSAFISSPYISTCTYII